MAFLIAGVALLCFGPSYTLNFPNKLWLTVVGICLLGVAVAFIFVPLLSEIIAAVKEKE